MKTMMSNQAAKVASSSALPMFTPRPTTSPLRPTINVQARIKIRRFRLIACCFHSSPRPQIESHRNMPLKTLDATVSNFDQIFNQFEADQSTKSKFILFLADKNPETNRSWCPDCNVAEPVIYKKLEASDNDVLVLRAYVGDMPTWRNPSHPMRVDARFKVRGVPTLIRWENSEIVGRLEDHEAHVVNKIDALLASK